MNDGHAREPTGTARINSSLSRREDERFLSGQGCYSDDRHIADVARAAIVRSPHAHAKITRIDCKHARTMPGVIAVFTAKELDADGISGLPWLVPAPVEVAGGLRAPPYLPLAAERVRYVGDAVALVVAETLDNALDAVEQVDVEYELLPVTVDPTNVDVEAERCFRLEQGSGSAVSQVLRDAPHVTSLRLVNNRVVPTALEPRGAIGIYDSTRGEYTLYTGTQTPHLARSVLANQVLNIPETMLRVIVDDVGGGFGAKAPVYREQALVLWASRRTGRPVKWIADRSESFICDTHGRDIITNASIGLDRDGHILAVDFAVLANLGAYLSYYGALPSSSGIVALAGVYRIPAIHVTVDAVFTNTVMNDAYRGAGRPEAVYALERLIDTAAREHGFSVRDLRKRNLIRSQDIPFRTVLGTTYDSGDFEAVLDRASLLADWDGFEKRRANSRAKGLLRGIGLGCYIERAGGGLDDAASVKLDEKGHAMIFLGTMSTGQGHETAYSQLVCEVFGIELEKVTVVQGDTHRVAQGRGTVGSRSLPVGGSALWLALEEILVQAREIACEALEVSDRDVEFYKGKFQVAGTDRAISLREVAALAHTAAEGEESTRQWLFAEKRFQPIEPTFPNGCHICEVEVDPDTGEVTVKRYTAVDDFGNEINPTLVDGQVQGGLAQGIGQAIMEMTCYDPSSGQLYSGSLMDYPLPRAADLPSFDLARESRACLNNPLGVKGCGEAGAIAAPPVVMNAILDALYELGVRDLDMPATPHRVWQAIRTARPI